MSTELSPEEASAKVRNALLWMVTIVAAAAMTMAGVTKFTAPDVWDEGFVAWGYGIAFKNLIGALEIVGGLAVLVPKLATYAATLVTLIMCGAVYTVLVNGGFPVAPSASLLVMFALIAYGRKDRRWTPGG